MSSAIWQKWHGFQSIEDFITASSRTPVPSTISPSILNSYLPISPLKPSFSLHAIVFHSLSLAIVWTAFICRSDLDVVILLTPSFNNSCHTMPPLFTSPAITESTLPLRMGDVALRMFIIPYPPSHTLSLLPPRQSVSRSDLLPTLLLDGTSKQERTEKRTRLSLSNNGGSGIVQYGPDCFASTTVALCG